GFDSISDQNQIHLRSNPLTKLRERETWIWPMSIATSASAYPEKFYAAASYIALDGFDFSSNSQRTGYCWTFQHSEHYWIGDQWSKANGKG
ncbi:hypothetical protein CARUB_v10002349mg, partial [Capsella rubella]